MSEPTLVRDFVPRHYADLPMLRLFLPAMDDTGCPRRWSDFTVDGVELTGSISWHEVWDRYAAATPNTPSSPTPSRGYSDSRTRDALHDALQLRLSPLATLTCLRWDGYGEPERESSRLTVLQLGHTFLQFTSTVDDIVVAGHRIPEFSHDDAGLVAWGTNLYPDSLIIASEPSIYRALLNDPRVDAVTVRRDSDTLPVSSGD
jgi:hypothetical protein